MEKIASSILSLVGRTPLVELNRLGDMAGAKARVVAKVESFNPGGSVKDRVAIAMVDDAEKRGILKPGATIIEPTSGNTGVGLALVSAVRGYHLILTMPETMSIERRRIVEAYGAEVVLTPAAEGMTGSIRRAEQLRCSMPGAVILGQFDNPANPEAHYATTALELWDATDGKIDAFVAGIGTGGTLTGTGQRLKEFNNDIKVIGVEPSGSPVITQGRAGAHMLQGIGAGFIPKNYRAEFVDQVIAVDDDQAIATARLLASVEGILCGISSGAAAYAALQLARRPEYEGRLIVALLPDTGERYLSTMLYDFGAYPATMQF